MVGMSTRALQCDGFPRQPSDRKTGKLLIAFPLDNHGAGATLQRLYAEQRRRCAGADRAVDDDINAAAFSDLEDTCERVVRLDVDHVVGTKRLRHIEASGVLRGTGQDHEVGASLLRRHQAAEALLSW